MLIKLTTLTLLLTCVNLFAQAPPPTHPTADEYRVMILTAQRDAAVAEVKYANALFAANAVKAASDQANQRLENLFNTAKKQLDCDLDPATVVCKPTPPPPVEDKKKKKKDN